MKTATEILDDIKEGIHHPKFWTAISNAMEEYKNQSASTPIEEAIKDKGIGCTLQELEDVYKESPVKEDISEEGVKDMLHTILNSEYEIYEGALRKSVVPVEDVKTAFNEYFGIEEEPNF